MKLIALVSLALLGYPWDSSALHFGAASAARPLRVRGIWAECEGVNATLSSRAKIEELFARCEKAGVNTVFLQVYRGNKAWYRSDIADASPYQDFYSREKICPLRLAIDLAHKKGMQVHAWINIFRVWGDRDAKIIRKLGRDAVTRDSRGRSLCDYSKAALPDSGYWLDPGDPKVRKYLISIIKEILERYPDIDGIHLDYVRYPFDEKGGVDFGYAQRSVASFQKAHGFAPTRCSSSQRLVWDGWRRDQVTEFVKEAGAVTTARGKKLSAAVVPDEEKCQRLTFQDWPLWVRTGLVNFVVPMNYSDRRRAVRKNTERSLRAAGTSEKVFIGLGAYKLLDSPGDLLAQIEDCRTLGVPGVVLFSYDNMTKRPELFPLLGKKAFGSSPGR